MIMLKLKFVQNLAILSVTNSSLENIIFGPREVLEILDLILVGYYKIKQGILQQNLSIYYRFESVDIFYEQFNKFINMLKKGKEEMKDKYQWLEQNDEKKNMSDRKILDKYVDLEKYCLSESEKKQGINMLYKYKDAFSLRDETGCTMERGPGHDHTLLARSELVPRDHEYSDRATKAFWPSHGLL